MLDNGLGVNTLHFVLYNNDKKHIVQLRSLFNNNNLNWLIWRNFKLEYYGKTDLTAIRSSKSLFHGENDSHKVYYFQYDPGASISQTLSVKMPTGSYILNAIALANGGVATLSANDRQTNIINTNERKGVLYYRNYNNSPYNNRLEFGLSSSDSLTIAMTADSTTGDHFLAWRGVQLIYNGPLATDKECQTLSDAIEAAESKTLGFDEGEYAPYNNTADCQTLETAKKVDITAAVQSKVQKAISSLTSTEWIINTQKMNAMYDGAFSSYDDKKGGTDFMSSTGWTATNSSFSAVITDTVNYPALRQASANKAVAVTGGTYQYGQTLGYTMPLKAHTTYRLSFKYAGWEQANYGFGASVINDNYEGLETQTYKAAQSGLQKDGAFITVSEDFTTGEAGNYTLSLFAYGKSTFTDVSIMRVEDAVTFSDYATEAPSAHDNATVTYRRKFYKGWNSIILPFETTLNEISAEKGYRFSGTTLKSAKNESYIINLTTIDSDGTLEANTPYIVYYSEDTPEENTLVFTDKTISPAEDLNITDGNNAFSFVGTYVLLPKGNDAIANGDYIVGEQGFIKAHGGNRVKAFRAYLDNVGGTAEAKGVNVDSEEVTGIEAVEMKSALTGNLQPAGTASRESPTRHIHHEWSKSRCEVNLNHHRKRV